MRVELIEAIFGIDASIEEIRKSLASCREYNQLAEGDLILIENELQDIARWTRTLRLIAIND